jgi:hypothetical protein
MKKFNIELVSNESKLLTGRSNGQRARSRYGIEIAEKYIITADPELLVTSSYFLGLLGVELSKFGTPREALEHLDLRGLSTQSQEECIKAVKRGLSKSSGLV